jgi:hypothetical protein
MRAPFPPVVPVVLVVLGDLEDLEDTWYLVDSIENKRIHGIYEKNDPFENTGHIKILYPL